MSGLLDKANETAKVAEKESPSIEAVVDVSEHEGVDKRIVIGLQVVGVVALISSLFWLVQTGWLYATAMDYMIAIMLMLFGWVLYNGSDYISESGLSNVKMAITAVAFVGLFVFTAVGTMFMNAGGGVTIASVEFDGKNDEIDLSFYGPSGMSYTIEVFVDGVVEYTHDDEIDRDRGSHSIALDEFWAGNAMDMDEQSQISYEIKVTSEGGEESFTFDNLMNREVDTAFISVLEKYTYENNGDDKIYEGIYVEMIVGMGTPNANFDFDDGTFSGTEPMPIESDWTATVRVLGGDDIVSYEITADEGVANGYGDFNFDWVSFYMNGGYLEKGDFYGDDGCYTFEITIENEHGATFVSTDSQIQFFWDDNEASNGDRPAEAC